MDRVEEMTLAFQRGEERGFEYFYRSLYPSLWFYALRFLKDKQDAEDAVEEQFIKIWNTHETFSHPQVIKSWLYTCVRNYCLNKLKEEKRRADIRLIYANELEEAEEKSLSRIIEAETIAEAGKIINLLPAACREIFYFLYVLGYDATETAEKLKVSISTVKTQKARGLEIIRTKIGITPKDSRSNKQKEFGERRRKVDWANVWSRLTSGLSVREIAEELKVPVHHIADIQRKVKANPNLIA